MGEYRVHNIRFYDLVPKAIHCISFERKRKKLAISRSDNSVEIWDVSFTPFVEKVIPGGGESSIEGLGWFDKRLFSAGLHGLVVEYDMLTLTVKHSASVTSGPAWCLEICKEAKLMAAGTEEGYVCIFHLTEEGFLFEKILNKQEGRVLCLDWSKDGQYIVTGSLDTVRVFKVSTGHAVQRMATGRAEKNKETIVWSISLLTDFTVITGDSRGKMSFWDGTKGVLSESIQTHKADILCLSVSEDENTVYAAGIDPTIVLLERVNPHGVEGERKRWVKSLHRVLHSHDVRSMVVDEKRLISGGVDSYLVMSIYPPKIHIKYPPLPQSPFAHVAPTSRSILLRYPSHLDLWRLSSCSIKSGIPGTRLPITKPPVKQLQLKSKQDKPIVCCGISDDSSWISYSTENALYLYHLHFEEDDLSLQKVRFLPTDLQSAHRLAFIPKSNRMVIATCNGDVQVLQLDIVEPTILHTFECTEEDPEPIHLLSVSDDGRYAVCGDHMGDVIVYEIQKFEVYCKLPRCRCQPTALGIHPVTNNIVVAYADQKILEWSIKKRKFTAFSQKLSHNHPQQWLLRTYPVLNISFDPSNEDIILLHDENIICVIDKDKDLPTPSTKLPRMDSPLHGEVIDGSSSSGQSWKQGPMHAFHICRKYKHLAFFASMNEEVVAMEISSLNILDKLPPALRQKKFGV